MFVHLHVHSQYSMLDGASSISAYLEEAARLEMPALALTDHNNVSGAVEFHQTAVKLGIKPIQGVEITTTDGTHLTLLAEDNTGYASICRILTAGHTQNPRGNCQISWEILANNSKGLIVLSGCRRSGSAKLSCGVI